MIFDDTSIAAMAIRLHKDGWQGDSDTLAAILSEFNRDTSVRLFADSIQHALNYSINNKEVIEKDVENIKSEFDAVISDIQILSKYSDFSEYKPMGIRGGPSLTLGDENLTQVFIELGSNKGRNGMYGENALVVLSGLGDDRNERRIVYVRKKNY
jgi:hypothetical protein